MTPLQRRLGLALGVTQVLSWATTFYIPATMIGAASESLGQSRAVLLGGFSWSLLVSAACAPRVGRYIDRHGGRPVLAAGALVTAAGLLALAAAESVVHWYLAWTVLGLGMAMGLYDVAFSTIGRLLGRESRPAITGVTLLGGFASSVGFPTGTWLVHAHGWRMAVVLYAVLHVVAILPIVLAFIPRAPQAAPDAAPQAGAAERPLPRKGAFVLLAVFFTTRSGLSALVSVHALVLLAGLGLTVDQAVLVASVIGPAQVGSRIVDYRLARGVSPVVSSWFGAALLPLGVGAMLAGAPPLVFALGYGLSNGIYTISRGTLPMHVYGPQGYATLLGRLALPALLAQAATPTLAAPLIEAWPADRVFALIGALSLAALCCLLPLRR